MHILKPFEKKDDKAFAQFEFRKGFKTTKEWTTIPMEHMKFAKNIQLNETYASVIFKFKGIYKLSVGFRPGTGSDVWMGIRLRSYRGKEVVGMSNLCGQIHGNDVGQHCFVFLANVNDIKDHYVVQIGRAGKNQMGILQQIGPWDGVITASVVVVVEFLGK